MALIDVSSYLPRLIGPLGITVDGSTILPARQYINIVGASAEDDASNNRTNITLNFDSPVYTGTPTYAGTRATISSIFIESSSESASQFTLTTITIGDETSVALDLIVTCRRQVALTKRGRWKFSALVTRTGGGSAILDVLDVGSAISVSGGAVTCDVTGNTFRVRPTPTDSDPRYWDVEIRAGAGRIV